MIFSSSKLVSLRRGSEGSMGTAQRLETPDASVMTLVSEFPSGAHANGLLTAGTYRIPVWPSKGRIAVVHSELAGLTALHAIQFPSGEMPDCAAICSLTRTLRPPSRGTRYKRELFTCHEV